MADNAPTSVNSADRRGETDNGRPGETEAERADRNLLELLHVMALAGLAAVGLAISAAVLLVVSYVAKGLPAAIITIFVVCLFGGLWFALPLARLSRLR